MYYVFGLLTIISAALLVLLVVIQNSKGGGLNSAFGTSNITSIIGTRRATQDIEKFTWYLALILLFFSFLANVNSGGVEKAAEPKFGNMMTAPVQQAAPASTPMTGEAAGEEQ